MSTTFQVDVKKKKVISDSTLCPSKVTKKEACWLYAKNNKYPLDKLEMKKIGKWMIFATRDILDDMWDKVKEAVKHGNLWDAKVSTVDHKAPKNHTHVVIIYTKDFEDIADVVSVLEYLESSGIKPEGQKIYYKTDQMTYSNVYANKKGQKRQKASIYDSVSVRTQLKNANGDEEKEADSSQSETESLPKKKKQKTFDGLSEYFSTQK